ncbi:MAG: hypothetical protein RBT86_08245 [Azospira sp.]|jgi:enamine deaminase RidA (YjgF/YER057c/UK114 family)|nr:hypothetical protein [Azospira sp.]
MKRTHPLTLSPLSPAELAAVPLDSGAAHLLGLAVVGEQATPACGNLPMQRVMAPLLGVSGPADERLGDAWHSAATCITGEAQGIRFGVDNHVLYGVVEVDEADFPARDGASALQRATGDAYRRIFRLLDAEGFPDLWRVWNYLADINVESGAAGDAETVARGDTAGGGAESRRAATGTKNDPEESDAKHGGNAALERYRQFNIGRQDAFLACGRLAGGAVPAACALGVRGGPLSIAFMAGREAALPLENPRQVSAWNYPADYGPRSPTFARGTLARLPGQALLFISGTASIVGHRTVHVGDVAAQTREALTNIDAVVGEAKRIAGAAPFALADFDYRAYVRHAADYPAVRAAMEDVLGSAVPVLYVQADICRADLLVEIEATGSLAAESD